MQIKHLLFISIFLITITGHSKSGILDYTISINIKSTPIKAILKKIEELGKIQFSYNPNMIDETKLVTLNIKQKSIRFGLNLIFDSSIRFKEVGKHIVLLKNESKQEIKRLKKEQDTYIFTGVITDELTGLPIVNASIYDVESHYATLSNTKGYYKLTIPVSESTRSLYFSKKEYAKVVIVIDASLNKDLYNNIELSPKTPEIDKITLNNVEQVPQTFQEKIVSGVVVSNETYQHSVNLEDIEETRLFQVSLVPSLGIGSNLSTNGLIINQFSLNLIGGYAKGLDGIELGGVFNIEKENVIGGQIAGITNLVGGNVKGVQIGGIANIVQGNFDGFQMSGVSSKIKQNLDGIQVSGIRSIVRGGFEGFQLSGITSVVKGGFDGVQISGISNMASGKSKGFQLAGVYNGVNDSLVGSQIAGIANSAIFGNTTAQVSCISNISNVNSGAQISILFNRTKVNNGFQLGLVNISRQSTGLAFGLINFVKKGYHKTEISTNELTHLNVNFKSGVKRLYNNYSYGIRFDKKPLHAIGIGFGSYFDLTKKMQFNLDLTTHLLIKDKNNFSYLIKFSPTIDYKLAKWVNVFAGPTFNMNFTYLSNAEDGILSPPSLVFKSKDYTGANNRIWIGGQIGLRF